VLEEHLGRVLISEGKVFVEADASGCAPNINAILQWRGVAMIDVVMQERMILPRWSPSRRRDNEYRKSQFL